MGKRYKKTILIFVLISKLTLLFSQNVAINTTGAAGNTAAILDMSANTTTGLLIPNVSISTITSPTCIVTSPALTAATAPDGLMVYNTNSTTTGGAGIGYYYWSHANLQWQYLQNSGTSMFIGIKVFTTATYTYAPDAGTNAMLVKMVGGGGGGGGGGATVAPGGEGGGGGAGTYCELYVSGIVYTANYYTGNVGQGGNGGTNAPATGNNGTATTFIVGATTYNANGGSGGALGSNANTTCNSNAGGVGGTASAISGCMVMSIPGTSGGYGMSNSMIGSITENGLNILGDYVLSGITPVSWGTGISGEGGNSVFGGQGRSVGGNTTSGIAALANTGSGGSGGSANYQGTSVSSVGGAGAAGIVIVYEYR
jgi:hypothetical protein